MDRLASYLMAALLAAAGCSGLLDKVKPMARAGNAGEGLHAPGANETIVPNLVGRTREEAIALVKAAGFTLDAESKPIECESAPQVEGRVSCQDPPAGQLVKKVQLVQFNVYGASRIAGAIVRSQLLELIGKEPEQARSALKGYGHDGDVKVAPARRFDEKCGENHVCGFDVSESGIGVHDSITLFVNPGLKIGAPPPQ